MLWLIFKVFEISFVHSLGGIDDPGSVLVVLISIALVGFCMVPMFFTIDLIDFISHFFGRNSFVCDRGKNSSHFGRNS